MADATPHTRFSASRGNLTGRRVEVVEGNLEVALRLFKPVLLAAKAEEKRKRFHRGPAEARRHKDSQAARRRQRRKRVQQRRQPAEGVAAVRS